MLIIPITQICKFPIKPSHFLKGCKLAKLKPVYEKVTKTDTKKFILLLPIVSKIIEKVIHDHTMDYLTENSILY